MPSQTETARDQWKLVAVDFEGTGAVKGYPDEPWQIGLTKACHDGAATGSPDACFESLLLVGDRPFNAHAPGRHADVRDQLIAAPSLPSLWPTLTPWLAGTVLVAHNTATEKRYLGSAFPLYRSDWIDTLHLSRIAYPGAPSHKLEALCEMLALTAALSARFPEREPHDALYDAVACALLLEHIIELPGWERITLTDLMHARPRPPRRSR